MSISENSTEFVVQRLSQRDVRKAAELCPFDGIGEREIHAELKAPDTYCWLALHSLDGDLAAVHRGMRWHNHLLLKGLFVDPGFAGPAVSLRVAMAMRDWAQRNQYAGIVAWVELGRRESGLAARLRLQPSSGLLHRFLVPLPDRPFTRFRSSCSRPLGGTVDLLLRQGRPLVPELLGVPQPVVGTMTAAWVLDRSRVVLSGNPCSTLDGLDDVLATVAELEVATGASTVELTFEAADLESALGLRARGAKRVSRAPITLGSRQFDRHGEPSRLSGRRPASIGGGNR
jgi:hypothetical protein